MKYLALTVSICATLMFYLLTETHAQTITVCGQNRTAATEDRRFPCTGEWINFFWDAYSMDEFDWDNGQGFDNACETRRPLGRTFNAIEMLCYAMPSDPTSTNDFSGNILHWGGNFSMREFDELDGECFGDSGQRAYTLWGSVDDYTELYVPFYYDENVVERAATLLHESRHADWCDHSGNDGSNPCPAHSESCDERFDGGDACDGVGSPTGMGATGFQALWLWWYLVEADSGHINTTMRFWAKDEANRIFDTMFDVCPGFSINVAGGQTTGNVCGGALPP
jgi:hypothetical protein